MFSIEPIRYRKKKRKCSVYPDLDVDVAPVAVCIVITAGVVVEREF